MILDPAFVVVLGGQIVDIAGPFVGLPPVGDVSLLRYDDAHARGLVESGIGRHQPRNTATDDQDIG